MSKDDVARDLETARAVAVLRLTDVVMGLVAYGLDRHETAAILDGVIDEALTKVYGGE